MHGKPLHCPLTAATVHEEVRNLCQQYRLVSQNELSRPFLYQKQTLLLRLLGHPRALLLLRGHRHKETRLLPSLLLHQALQRRQDSRQLVQLATWLTNRPLHLHRGYLLIKKSMMVVRLGLLLFARTRPSPKVSRVTYTTICIIDSINVTLAAFTLCY